MWTMKYHKFLYIWMQAKKNKQTIHILACILFDDLLTT